MAEGTRVGTAHISIFADDSPFRRRMQTIGRGVQRKVEVAVEANERSFRQSFENMTRRGGKVQVDVEVDGEGEITALQAFLAALRDKKVKVDIDSRPAVRAAAAVTAGLSSASKSVDNFNRAVYTMGNVLQVVARVGILGLIGAIAPLIGVLTVATAGAVALAGGLGLLAVAALPSIAALTNHETASKQAESANQALEQAEESLADTIRSTTEAVEEADKARTEAAENVRRVAVQNAEDLADADRKVADARRARDDALAQRNADNIQAERDYRDAIASRSEVERENAQRLADAYAAMREADQEYTRVVQENTQRLKDARRELIGLQREYADLQRENAEEEQDQLESIAEAQEAYTDTVAEGNEAVADAYEAAADAADDVTDAEEDLFDAREDLKDATEDLREAQEDLNDAMRDEALVQASIANDAEAATIAYQQQAAELANLQQEYQDAVAAGDTITAGELQLDIAEAQNELEAAAIANQQAQNDLAELQEEGTSQQLQDAQNAVEAAYQAVQDQEEQVQDARERLRELKKLQQEAEAGILEAQKERDEAIAAALERIREEKQALKDLREDNAREEQEALRRIREQQQEISRTIQENAQREREAAAARLEARRNISRVEAENRRALKESEREINEAYLAMRQTERDGNEMVAESERAITDSIRERRVATREARWEARDARATLEEAQEAYEDSVSDRARQIARAREDVRGASDEAKEAAEAFGASLTASQTALLAAAISFKDSFLTAFRPAQDAFNYLAVDILAFAQQGLPYFGRIARETVEGLRKAFESIREEILNPRQLATFRGFFDRVPAILTTATTALGDLLIGVFNILAQGLPFFEQGLGKVAEWFDKLLRWTQSSEGKRAIQEFFEDASYFAGILVDVLADVAKFLFRIGTSEAMKDIFANVAQFVDWIARNPEGIQTALWFIARLGDVLMFILNLPFAGKGIAFLGGFAATIALFAAPGIAVAIGSLSFLSAVLRGLTGRGILGNLRQLAGGRGLGGLTRALQSAGRAVGQFARAVGRQLGRVPRVVFNALRSVPRLVAQIFGSLPARAAQGIARFAQFVGRGLARIPQIAFNALRGIGRIVTGIFRDLPGIARSWLRVFGRTISSILAGAGRWFSPLTRVFSRLFTGNGVLSRILGIFAGRLVPRLLGRLTTSVFGPAGWAVMFLQLWTDAWIQIFGRSDWIRTKILEIAGWLSGKGWVRGIIKFWQNLPGWLKEGFAQGFKSNPIFKFVIEEVDRAQKAIFAMWGIKSPSTVMKYVGQMLVAGMIEGVYSWSKKLFDYLYELAKSAMDYIDRAFDFGSPSKEMKKRGRWIAEGLAEGIRGAVYEVRNAGRELSDAASIGDIVLDRRSVSTGRNSIYRGLTHDLRGLERRIEALADRPMNITVQSLLDGEILDSRTVRVLRDETREAYRGRNTRKAF